MKLIVSGSVVLSNPTWSGSSGHCSGDDWDCYQAEQSWLINLLMDVGDLNSGNSPILLVGDYHYADFKKVCPGPSTPYGSALGIDHRDPGGSCVYQHMSSGLSHSTAVPHANCDYPPYLGDYAGMRSEASQDPCSVVQGPNFGQLDVDIRGGEITLMNRNETGEVVTSITLDLNNRSNVKRSITYRLGG